MEVRSGAFGWIACLGMVTACDMQPSSRVDVTLGSGPEDRHSFVAEAAFAEYIELPGAGNELTLTLASYKASCERFEPPPPGQAVVTTVAFTSRAVRLGPGTYPWSGHDAHGGTPLSPQRAYAVPTVRVGGKSFLIQPGGALELSRADLGRDGRIRGLLKFESPGDGIYEATSIKGSFDVPLCRFREVQSRP